VLGAGEIAARLIAFAATVYLARTLGASAFGVIGFASAITLYLARIADCGIEFFGLGIREIAEDRGRITTMVPSVTAARLGVAVFTAVIVAIVSAYAPQPDGTVIALYALTLISLAGSMRWVLLGLERSSTVAVSRIVGEALFALIVFLSVRSAAHVTRVPLAQFAGDTFAAVIVAAALWRSGIRLRSKVNLAVVQPIFRRSWRLVVSALLGLVIYNSGLILLRFFRDTATVGFFAAAYTFVTFMLNLGGAYNQTLLPTLTRDAEGSASVYGTAMVHSFAVSLPVAIGGTLVAAPLIDSVFGGGYASAVLPLQVLLWAVPFALLREVATAGLMARSGEKAVLTFTTLTAIASVALNLLLIPRFGLAGAAVATVATEIVRFAASAVLADSRGFSPARLTRFGKPLLAASGMAVAVLLSPANILVRVSVGVVTYALLLALLGGVRLGRGRQPEIVL
jgi:O-antigen/teichoic acid export membrane protein